MADLKGKRGELKMTIQITRAETGKVDEYELVGTKIDEEINNLTEGVENGNNTLNSGA